MLKENINTKWPVYRDRVVRQLVGETEIDFKNSRVRLEAAEYSFPFYSFGARRAYPENLISEPKSNFGKYIISNYGVDETEYKEIYAMYMGIIASRLQDHDENVNHLHLHESTEDNFLNTIVDQLVSETEIDYEENKMKAPFIYTYERHWFSFPLPYSIFVPVTTQFFNHCRDVYGITNEEIRYVWKNYESIILDKLKRIEPLNESIEDNFLDTIVDQLVGESKIDYEKNVVYPPYPSHLAPYNLYRPFYYDTPDLFTIHCRDIYGLTEPEIEYVWEEYKQIITDKIHSISFITESTKDEIKNKPLFALIDGKRLNESKQIDYLDKVVEYLVYDSKDDKLPFDNSYISFNTYIKNIYGIRDEEVDYVYFKYRYLVGWDEVRRYNEYLPEPLNESREYNFLNTIVYQLVGETIIDHEQEEIILPHHSYPLLYDTLPVGLLLPARYGPIFFKHCRDIYGITEDEIQYVWGKYINILKDEIENG